MKAVKFLVVFCFVLLSGFQVFGQTDQTPQQNAKSVSDRQEADKSEALVKSLAAKNQTDEKYRIGFQDSIEILVAKHPDLSQRVNVGSDGTIRLPRIDQAITVVCKTERELKETLETLYKSYLKNPYVNVRVIEQNSQPVAVIGAVKKPGAINLNRKVRLLELLSLAGGPDVEYSGSKIQIARVGNATACIENTDGMDDEKVEFFSYKLDDVQKGIVNPQVRPGDVVSVLIAEEAYVVGDVGEPTKISLRDTVTLTQAIAAAGGIGAEAKTSKVRIQRQEANSAVRTELVFDLKDITSRKIADPILQANDIVEVPKSGIKSAGRGILKALTGGIPTLIRGY
jgi:polysaccharide export outer membrane protein